MEFLENFFKMASSDNEVEKVLVGDFNFPNVSWVSGNVVGPKNSVNKSIMLQKIFVDGVHNK